MRSHAVCHILVVFRNIDGLAACALYAYEYVVGLVLAQVGLDMS